MQVLGDTVVRPIGSAEHGLDLGLEISSITLVDPHAGDHHPFAVTKGDLVTGRESVGELVGNVEDHGDRP